MRILADTHVLLWWLADAPELTGHHRSALGDPGVDVFFSAVSVAEMAIKASTGRLHAPSDVSAVLVEGGFEPLPFTAAHAERLRTLPWHHRDPFDRMLVVQAQHEALILATQDRWIRTYDVAVL